MAKSIEDQVLDKKTKEQIRQELLEVINTKVKDQLVETVANDVKETFDAEKKEEIKEEISQELIIDIKEEINKEQKKLTRKKSFQVFRLKFLILLLIAVIVFLVYRLYLLGGIDLLNKVNIPGIEQVTTTTQVVNKDFDYYLEKYGYLVNSFNVTNLELLKGTYNISDVDITDKLAMVYNSLGETDIVKEGIIYSVSNDVMKNSYIKLFGSEEGYRTSNFYVNGISYAYQESTTSYLAIVTGTITKANEFLYEIESIKEDGTNIVITTKVGLVKDEELYNVFDVNNSLGKVSELKKSDYLDKLSVVEYTFKKINNKYYINSISKK